MYMKDLSKTRGKDSIAWCMVTQSVTGMLTHCMVVTQFVTVRGCSLIIIDHHSHLYFFITFSSSKNHTFQMAKNPVTVLDTGAAGQIGYAIVPMIARGIMLGPDQSVILHLFDIEQAAESLHGTRMELTDAALRLLKDVVEACKDVNIAIMLGGSPRKEITLRKDMLSTNMSIYKAQALASEEHAAADCKGK